MAGPLGGAVDGSGSVHHRVLEDVDGAPLWVLPVGLAAATTKLLKIDGGPPGGATGEFNSGHP
jgi:hypothetical protein